MMSPAPVRLVLDMTLAPRLIVFGVVRPGYRAGALERSEKDKQTRGEKCSHVPISPCC